MDFNELRQKHAEMYSDKQHPCHNDSKKDCIHCSINCGGKGFEECSNAYCDRLGLCVCDRTECKCKGR